MRLFWKIFITMLVVLSLTALVAGWLSKNWLLEQHAVENRIDLLEQQGETAAGLFASEGLRAYGRWLGQSMRRQHAVGFLIDHNGQHVLPRPLPPEIKPLLRRLMRGGREIKTIHPPLLTWAGRIETSGQTWYWIASTRLPSGIMQRNRRTQTLIYLLTALGFVLTASLFMSRIITRPIEQLRQTSRHLGEGNLDARPSAGLLKRRDEIGQLARDFSTMGAQISSLLSSHKQLLRDISHELRSPLARLLVALELARSQPSSSQNKLKQQELDRIEIEADRINQLIEEVLTLARFDQDGITLQQESVQLDQLIEQLGHDLKFEADAKPCNVRFEIEKQVTILGDGRWLSRAIENIARNAIHHTARDSDIVISMSSQSNSVKLMIHDHGPGVPEEKLPYLFEPFYRASEGRERESGGYGLGLAIAKRVIGSHHGSVSASNHTQGGLMVTVSLPTAPTSNII